MEQTKHFKYAFSVAYKHDGALNGALNGTKETLTDYELQVLNIILEHRGINQKGIKGLTEISTRTLTRILSSLEGNNKYNRTERIKKNWRLLAC